MEEKIPNLHDYQKVGKRITTIENVAIRMKEAETLRSIREHMLLLNEQMNQIPVSFAEGNDLIRLSFESELQDATERLLRMLTMYRDMFFGSPLLTATSEFLKSKIAQRIKTPGESWDPELIRNVCQVLSYIPISQLQINKDFLKTVWRMSNSHVLRMGAGIWFSIHHLTANVKNQVEHDFAIQTLHRFADFFPCHLCRDHYQSYLMDENTKPEKVPFRMVDIDKPEKVPSLWLWSIVFHNNANVIRVTYSNNTPIVHFSIDEAYQLYFADKDAGCNAGCH